MNGFILIFWNSILQFLALFGPVLIAAVILSLLSRWTNNVFRQFVFPRFGTYFFGWIGVPVHEFSHAFFCCVFFHKVQKVKWFDPKAKGGSHGSVTHTYQGWNLYHRVGHFFIGLGPVLLCPIVLAVFYWVFVPGSTVALIAVAKQVQVVTNPFLAFEPLLHAATFKNVWFWLFLYIAAAICSQVELSREDLKQALIGVIPLFLLLLLANTGAWAFNWSFHGIFMHTLSPLHVFLLNVYGFAVLLALVTLVLSVVAFGIVNKISGRTFVNPFSNK